MADDERGFEQAYRSNLGPAQRREILATLRATLKRNTTLGEIIDAAESLGWGEAMGDLRLADLARSLLLGEESAREVDASQGSAASVEADQLSGTREARREDKHAYPHGQFELRPGDIHEDEGLEALDDADSDGSDVFAGDLVAELAPPSRKGNARAARVAADHVDERWEPGPAAKARGKSTEIAATQQALKTRAPAKGKSVAPSKKATTATVSAKKTAEAKKPTSKRADPKSTSTKVASKPAAAKKATAKTSAAKKTASKSTKK